MRKRLKIATLPTAQMQQAVERGGKLEDYVQIADIKDEEERRELLKLSEHAILSLAFLARRGDKLKPRKRRLSKLS